VITGRKSGEREREREGEKERARERERERENGKGIVMLECLSVCRCSLLIVDLMVMMDSHVERGVQGPVVNERGLRQVYGSFPPPPSTTTTIYGE